MQQVGGSLGLAVLVTVFGTATKNATGIPARHVFVVAADQAFWTATLFLVGTWLLVAFAIRTSPPEPVRNPCRSRCWRAPGFKPFVSWWVRPSPVDAQRITPTGEGTHLMTSTKVRIAIAGTLALGVLGSTAATAAAALRGAVAGVSVRAAPARRRAPGSSRPRRRRHSRSRPRST